jgi:hypothetical protein
MAKPPDDRYSTARALGEDLARFLAGGPVEAPRRSRRAAAVVAAAVVVAGIAAAASLEHGSTPQAPSAPLAEAPVGPSPAPKPADPAPRRPAGRVLDYRNRTKEQGHGGTAPDRVPLCRVKTPWSSGRVIVRFLDDQRLAVLGSEKDPQCGRILHVDDEAEKLVTAWVWGGVVRGQAIWACHDRVMISVGDRIYSSPDPPPADRLPVKLFPAFVELPLSDVLPAAEGALWASALSPDGALFAIGGTWKHVRLYDANATTAKVAQEIPVDQPVASLAFSPDGKHLALGLPDHAEIWAVGAGAKAPSHRSKKLSGVRAVAFSPKGDTLAIGNLGNVMLWRPEEDREEQLRTGTFDGMNALVFGKRRSVLYGATDNLERGGDAIYAFDLERPSPPARCDVREPIASIDLSPDGTILAVGTARGGLELWPAW